MKRKFVLVDPSFVDRAGDKWQYAITFAKSARKNGFDFVLLTHERAPRIQRALNFRIRQRNIFPHTFYDHDKIVSRNERAWSSVLRRRLDARTREEIEALDGARKAAMRYGPSLESRFRDMERKIVEARAVVRAGAARLADGLRGGPVAPLNRDDYALALARELPRLNLGAGDRVFVHMTTPAMMESLSEVTAAWGLKPPLDVDAHFLFHFGAAAPDARTFLNRLYSYSHPASLKQRLEVGAPFRRLHFHATSEALKQELEDTIGVDVSLFHGLTDFPSYQRANGGEAATREAREAVRRELADLRVRMVVRAADLDEAKALAVARTAHLVQHRGFSVDLRIIYHAGSVHKLGEVMRGNNFPFFTLVNTESNDDYIRELTRATLVILPYNVNQYEKRVSAVLHDCSVLGVPAVVPVGTTLEGCVDHAAVFRYATLDDLLGATLNAVRATSRNFDLAETRAVRARELYATDVVERLLAASTKPLAVHTKRRVACVVHPMWGRCGSSHTFEAQARHLMSKGYFTHQILVTDKPFSPERDKGYLWRMLEENSSAGRGSVQRVAYVRSPADYAGLRRRRRYLKSDALSQLAARIGQGRVWDRGVERTLRRADVCIVNHVFNSVWARRHVGGKHILDSHDIQSFNVARWPLHNDANDLPEALGGLLAGERRMVSRFNYVVNVVPEEHAIMTQFNPHGVLVTPYVMPDRRVTTYESVSEMAIALGWDECYSDVETFDILILGDSHPANVESARWFVEEVFKRYLQSRGIRLAVCGRLSNALHEKFGKLPNVYYVGFVQDLASVKALSKIWVLPDRHGTGLSIKTLEAFASGMAFVGTRHSFRGVLEQLPPELHSYDDPREMADAVLAAVSAPSRIADLERLSRECYERTASEAVWKTKWDIAIEGAGVRKWSR